MEQKSCKNCGTEFIVEEDDLKFLDKMSPTFNGKKYQIPTPTFCPDCRQQRRLSYRNEHNLYKRTCDQCNKDIISCYHDKVEFPVYCPDCWWSDKWEAMDYGRDVDFSRSFIEQFNDLRKIVPRIALSAKNNENSDFVNLSGYNKNCYLIFAAEYNEDCMYGTQVIKCNDCVDTLVCTESSYSYEVTDVSKCYEVFYSKNCRNCNESMFLSDCRSCNNCLFCTNLRNKQYHIFNKPVSKEEYEAKREEILKRLNNGELVSLMKELLELDREAVHRDLEMQNNENSFGNYLFDSKNCKHCYDLTYGEDCKYVYTGFQVRDLMDVCHTTDAELGYEATSLGYTSNNILFGVASWSGNNGIYFDNCHNSSDVFGSAGIRNQKFCILNKKYPKDEYEKIVGQIIEKMIEDGEWGEFPPINQSQFSYNETLAQDYFPLTKEVAIEKGYSWKDLDPKEYQEATDDVLACEDCKKNYKIVAKEQAFYTKMKLPVPKKCPDCRSKLRMSLRNPRKIFDRNCSKCSKDVKSTYSPDRPEKVYCEPCYLKEIV